MLTAKAAANPLNRQRQVERVSSLLSADDLETLALGKSKVEPIPLPLPDNGGGRRWLGPARQGHHHPLLPTTVTTQGVSKLGLHPPGHAAAVLAVLERYGAQ